MSSRNKKKKQTDSSRDVGLICMYFVFQFFAIFVTMAYGASTAFAYIEWKGDGGNAAMTTVPV